MHLPDPRSETSFEPAMTIIKNSLFYSAPQVEFQVENELFRVAREGFENSSKFMNLFKISSTAELDPSAETVYELRPIEIPNIKAVEFAAFLKILIRPPCGSEGYEVLEEDLESALKLATLWDFEAVRRVAIEKIESLFLGSTRIIQLAQLYDVTHWVTPEVERLALRPESLTDKELKQIGFDIAAEICAFRDMKSHLALQMAKDLVSSKNVDLVNSCISKHIRKQRDHDLSDVETFHPLEITSRSETESGDSATLKDKGSDEETSTVVGLAESKPIVLSRDRVQEALDCSQADRLALDERISSLKAQLGIISDMERQARYEEKVKLAENDIKDGRVDLINAQIALADIVIRAPRRSGSGIIQSWPVMDVYSPQVEAENLIRACRARNREAETRLNEAKAGLHGA